MPGSGAAVIDKCNRQHRAEVQGVIVPRPFSLRIYLHDLPCVMVVIYFARLLRALFLGCIKGRRFCLAGMFLRRASERQGEEAAAGGGRTFAATLKGSFVTFTGHRVVVSFARNELRVGERTCDLFTCPSAADPRGGGGVRKSLGSLVKSSGGGWRAEEFLLRVKPADARRV